MTGSGARAGSKSTAKPVGANVQGGLFDGAQVHAEVTSSPVLPPDFTPKRSRALKSKPKVDDKSGHRERLRQRFRNGGPDGIADYELLEMVLFGAFPRIDTKPLAKALIEKFKSFNEVVNAAPERLREVEGIGQRAIDEIKLIRVAALRMMQGQIIGKTVLATWTAVLDYIKAAQAYDDKERFRILFLDKRNQLIADEVQQTGTVDHTPVYVREVVKRALEHGATALVLVHNHPSGDPQPSRADIDMTKMIVDAAKPLGITIHDHVIVGRQGHVSLRAAKLM